MLVSLPGDSSLEQCTVMVDARYRLKSQVYHKKKGLTEVKTKYGTMIIIYMYMHNYLFIYPFLFAMGPCR